MKGVDPPVRYSALTERLRAAVRSAMEASDSTADPVGLYVTGDAAWLAVSAAVIPAVDARLADLAGRLGLDRLHATVLALAAAPQLDPRLEVAFAYLQERGDRRLPTPRVISALLDDAEGVHDCFTLLQQLGCLALEEGPPADAAIHVAPEVGAFLLDLPAEPDPKLRRVERTSLPLGRPEQVALVARYLAQPGDVPVLVAGPDAPLILAAALERPLLMTSIRDIDDSELQRRATLVCALEGRAHAHDGLDGLEADEHQRLVAALDARRERSLLCMDRPTARAILALNVEVPLPSLAERAHAWRELSGAAQTDDVASGFRLSISQIARAAEVARSEAAVAGRDVPEHADLARAARIASATRLGELAVRLDAVHGWDDLVLPPRQVKLLRSISAYLRQRERVLGEWGYGRTVARNQGVKAMFAGESGTGKTMGAQVIARELGLDIFRVDLATIVSKYIGETEKNLDRIFQAAEGSNAILFFDEADALFGKRSEVQDAHDRYANIEVAYLLQKMEGYAGAVILATNYKQNVDDAFLRRLDFVVVFPFPEPPSRRRIWDLVLPAEAPLADDVDLDFLSERFRLSGGAIRNCSIAAAFMAADAGGPITMEHMVRAVAVEYGKLGRLTLEADFGRFHQVLDA